MGAGGRGSGPDFKILAELGVDPRSIPNFDKDLQRVAAQSGKKFQASLQRGLSGADTRLLGGLRSGFQDVTKEIDLTGQTVDKVSRNPLKRFTGALEKAEGSLEKYGVTSRDVAIIAGAGLAGGIAFALRSVVQFTQASIQAASALREQKTASEELFGAQAGLVQSFAEGAAASGFSERAALEASNSFANLFVNLGLGEEQVARFSTGLVSLAGDLASFRDLTPEEVLTRLNSGLIGELETLRRLGPQLSANIIQREAETRGIVAEGQAVSEAQKVLIRFLLVLEQTEVAQGDFARTSDSLANKQRQLNAEWENAKAALGDSLQGPATAVTGLFAELARGVDNLFTAINRLVQGDIGGFLEQVFIDPFQGVEAEDFAGEAFDSMGEIRGELARLFAERDALAAEAESHSVGKRVLDNLLGTDFHGEAAALTDEIEALVAHMEGLGIELDLGDIEANAQHLANVERAVTGLDSAAAGFDFDALKDEIAGAAIDARDTAAALKELEDSLPDLGDVLDRVSERSASAGDRIADANQALSRTIRDSNERIVEARERVVEVEERAARSIEEANERIQDAHEAAAEAIESAQERVADAIKRVQDAEEALAKTREDAAERIADAEERLALLRRRGLRESDRQRRLREIAEAEKAIVEAREDAAERIEDAEERVLEARRDLTDAEEELAKTRVEQDKRIQEAMEARRDAEVQASKDIADAKKALARTERDAAESIADAQKRVADAHKSSGKAARDNARDLEKLIEQLQKGRDALTPYGLSLLDAAAKTDNVAERTRILRELFNSWERDPAKIILDTSQASDAIDKLNEKLNFLMDNASAAFTVAGEDVVLGITSERRQHGGPVRGGSPYLVGERGPELFIPNSRGEVISNDVLEKLLAALQGLGGRANEFNISLPSADPDLLVRALSSRLGRRTRR